MPIYQYFCEECGELTEERRPVEVRNQVSLCECGGLAVRYFRPTVYLIVPGHFKLDRTWAEPPPGDPAWENMSAPGARGGIHEKRVPTLKDEFDKVKEWG